MGGGGAPRPLQNRSHPGLPSPAPQTWPGNRISSSLHVLVETGQQGTPSCLSSRPVPRDDHHPFPPKGSGLQGRGGGAVWLMIGKRGLCLVVATNTSVQRIYEWKQAVPVSHGGRSGTEERRAGTGGKVAPDNFAGNTGDLE